MSCGTCTHFLGRGAPDATAEPKAAPARVGICRRYPPKAFNPTWSEVGGVTVSSVFPEVHTDQQCGEFVVDPKIASNALSERYAKYKRDIGQSGVQQ